MSYFEDFIEPYIGELENKLEIELRDYWVTKHGLVLEIKEMTDGHILNTIKKFGEENVPLKMIKEAKKRRIKK